MSSEEEDKVLFMVYHISGYSGSIGSPDITADSIGATPVDIVYTSEMGDDVTLN